MLETLMRYAKGFEHLYHIDEVTADSARNKYLRASRGKGTCKGRKKKRNMLHVSRSTKSRHKRV